MPVASVSTSLPRPKPVDTLLLGVCAGALVPLVVMVWRLSAGLYADPIAQLMNQTGFIGLILLIASLACTPLKLVCNWTGAMRLRKALGLLSFGYICLHFLIYFGADQFFNVAAVLDDIVKRPFITVGSAAFSLLIPLAFTSTTNAIRKMGAKKWQALHKLAYVAGILGIIHFVWRVKSDFREPAAYGAVLAALLLVRVLFWAQKRLRTKRK